MKMRKKGKVHPSPSSSSSMPSASANSDAMSVLKLLPAAILALASVLSLEDREVLAYIITRSLKSYSNPSSIIEERKNKINSKKSSVHKSPVFDCGCFDCYTSYWFRWDSSPNRELIHQAIEAFEEHLAAGEKEKRNSRGKRREKMSRRVSDKVEEVSEIPAPEKEADVRPETFDSFLEDMPKNEASLVVSPEKVAETVWSEEENVEEVGEDSPEEMVAQLAVTTAINHKGLARKVLPDVLGLLNSRLWSLWSPNV